METIRVNMTPCEDVQTIHASQNDNEGREWGFELHNNGEKIDSSSISDQLVFKAYEGGTEEILPTNGSTPTTSPFKGDIKYPQGLLSDQEFLYRESPTEEDGLAKITDIKGNTLVWNQLADTSNYFSALFRATKSISGNTVTLTDNRTSSNNNFGGASLLGRTIPVGHDVLVSFNVTSLNIINFTRYTTYLRNSSGVGGSSTTNLTDIGIQKVILTATAEADQFAMNFYTSSATTGSTDTVVIKDIMVFDLTAMGLDISNPSDFTSLFPLSYYAYNQGTLLSFMGNGIKTVGKNKFNITRNINVTIGGVTFKSNADKSITVNGTTTANATITQLNGFTVPNIKKGESLIWSGGLNRPVEQAYAQLVYNGDETGQTYSFVSVNNQSALINATESMTLSGVYISCRSGNTFNNETFYPMLRYANTDSSYEPYTSSTLSLPISTYFPSGMKSAGDVYDELTPSKAITRIGAVDLGTLSWDYDDTYSRFYSSDITDIKNTGQNVVPNLLVVNYRSYSLVDFNRNLPNMAISYVGSNGRLVMRNTSFTDATAFKTAMDGVYLYYELATPTETPITTASLVTENGEIPLSNEDGVLIGKCTEQLSAEPGFHDAKIKLADEDGECYSNKIQLHVERKPS